MGPNVTLVLDYAVPMRLVCLIREAQKQPPRNLAGDTYRFGDGVPLVFNYSFKRRTRKPAAPRPLFFTGDHLR